MLRAGLALSDTGTLPFHQIEPALDQVGMRGEPVVRRRLKGWRLQQLPAILELTDDRAAVLLETQGRRRRWSMRPARPSRCGCRLRISSPPSPAMRLRSKPDPTRERAGERPWDKARREHWFWSEVWKVRARILAGHAGRADRQPAGARRAAVHDERLRPGHPQQGDPDPVGAGARRRRWRWRSTSRCASPGRSWSTRSAAGSTPNIRQKLFEKVMNLPMAERQGSTGAFAKRGQRI